MENKYLWAAIAFVAGFYLAKKRTEKKITEAAQNAADEAVDKATAIFDDMLLKAQNAGKTVADVRAAIQTV